MTQEGIPKQKSLARFASECDTKHVYDFFQTTKQSISALGESRLFVVRLSFVKYTLPTMVFNALNVRVFGVTHVAMKSVFCRQMQSYEGRLRFE